MFNFKVVLPSSLADQLAPVGPSNAKSKYHSTVAAAAQHAPKLRSTYKEAESWVITAANGDGTYDVQKYIPSTGGLSGTTGPAPAAPYLWNVPVITPFACNFFIGQTVTVRWTKGGSPYIKGPNTQGSIPITTSVPTGGLTINLLAGMWIQCGGFFWDATCSDFSQLAFNFVPSVITVTETFTANPYVPTDPPTEIHDSGLGTCYIICNLPPTGVNITPISALVNGSISLTSLTLTGTTNVFFTYGSGGFPSGPDLADTSPLVTSIALTYSFIDSGATSLGGGVTVAAEGPMSHRGVVCYPSPDPATKGNQMVSTLSYNYVGSGSENIPTPIDETTGLVGDNQYSITSSQIPVDTPSFIDFFGLDYLGADYIGGNVGSSFYGFAALIAGDGILVVSYEYASSGSVVIEDEVYTPGTGQSLQQNYISDGTTTVYTTANASLDSITVCQDGSDVLTANITAANQFTLSTPVNQNDTINLQYIGTVGDGVANAIGVAWPISSINWIYVDGNFLDLGTISFNGYQVTLPSPVMSSIEINYNTVPANYQTDTFDPTDYTDYVNSFTLTYEPITGTIEDNGSSVFNTGGQPYQQLVTSPMSGQFIIQFPIEIPNGTNAEFKYNYNVVGGNLYYSTQGTIREVNVNTSVVNNYIIPWQTPSPGVNVTPNKLFTGAIGPGQPAVNTSGWDWQNQYHLYFDPSSNRFIVIGIDGIYIRNRTTGTTLGVDVYYLKWPTQIPSVDNYIVGNNYTPIGSYDNPLSPLAEPGTILQRNAPYQGTSWASIYGASCSFATVGPNNQYAPSDVDFPLQFFQVNATTQNPMLVNSVSVRKLVSSNAGIYPLLIGSSGICYQDADGGYASSRLQSYKSMLYNSIASTDSHANCWYVPVSWAECNWGLWSSSVASTNNSQDNFHLVPVGDDDAGLTLAAVDMAGNVKPSLTFKSSNTYIETAFTDVTADNTYTIAHTEDFLSGTLPIFTPTPQYQANQYFGLVDGLVQDGTTFGGFCYLYWLMQGLDGDAKQPSLKLPGPVTLASIQNPRYAYALPDAFNPQNYPYGNAYSEVNGQQSLEIAGDSDDNFYFCIGIPYWVRTMDKAEQQKTVRVTGTITAVYAGGYTTQTPAPVGGNPLHGCGLQVPVPPGYTSQQGFNMITGFLNPLTGFPDNTVLLNGVSYPIQIYTGQTTGGDPVTGLQAAGYSCGIYNPNPFDPTLPYGDIVAIWYADMPNPDATLVGQYYDGGSDESTGVCTSLPSHGEAFGIPPGYIGGQYSESQSGYTAVLSLDGDNRQQYDHSSLVHLVKVNATNGVLTKVWEKNISLSAKMFADGLHTTAIPVSVYTQVLFTRPVGRFVVLLRAPYQQTFYPFAYVTSSALSAGSPSLYIETWSNPDSSTPPTLLYTTPLDILPGFTLPGTAGTKPPYTPGQPTNVFMSEGVDSTGAEWVLVSGFLPGGNYPLRWRLKYNLDLFTAPELTYDNSIILPGVYAPDGPNAQGMAQAQDNFYYQAADGTLIKNAGG